MDPKGYYSLLGVSPKSSIKDIKSQYKKQALKLHPDKNPDNPNAKSEFQKVLEAYSILSDDKKREMYDKYGSAEEEDFDVDQFMDHFTFDDLMGMMNDNQMFGMEDIFASMSGPESRRTKKNFKKTRNNNNRDINNMFEQMANEMTEEMFQKPKKKKKEKKKEDDDWETESDEEEWSDEEEAFMRVFI